MIDDLNDFREKIPTATLAQPWHIRIAETASTKSQTAVNSGLSHVGA
jgi:hypothetical protein